MSLLLTNGFECPVLQPLELEFEKLEIHHRLSAEVLPLPLLETLDSKHRRSASVRPSDLNFLELASSQEHVRSQEKVIGLDQGSTSFSREPAPSAPNPRDVPVPGRAPAPASDSVPRDEALYGWNEERWTKVRIRGDHRLSSTLGPRRRVRQDFAGVGPFSVFELPVEKPLSRKNIRFRLLYRLP